MDMRDSSMQNRSIAMARKARAPAPDQAAPLVTPWGTALGSTSADAAVSVSRGGASARPQEPTPRTNHFQNRESPVSAGTYRVPDVSNAHNHFQNRETAGNATPRTLRKMGASKINDVTHSFHPPERPQCPASPEVALLPGFGREPLAVSRPIKVACGASRINAGNDIFGPPIVTGSGQHPTDHTPRRRLVEPFVPQHSVGSGVRSPWVGYTDASKYHGGASTGGPAGRPF